MTDPGDSVPVRRLDLRTEVSAQAGGLTVVTVLVDGVQIFANVGGQHYRGWHPALVLDPDNVPLLPATLPRRVGIYPAASLYPAEGCVTAIISAASDRVVWADIRDRYGYHQPDPPRHPAGDGKALAIPDLVFDSVQYRAEVTRATASRSWETPELVTARLLHQHLRAAADHLAAHGWTPEFTEARADGYWVAFRDLGDAQFIVAMSAPRGTSQQQAATMAETLLKTPPQQWPVIHCSTCGHDERQPGSHPAARDTSAGHPHPPPARQ